MSRKVIWVHGGRMKGGRLLEGREREIKGWVYEGRRNERDKSEVRRLGKQKNRRKTK